MTLIKLKNDRSNNPRTFNEMLESFFNTDFNPVFNTSDTPAVNVVETKDNYKLEVAVPGMSKENMKINVDGNMLTVSGKNETKNSEEKENYTRKEFSFSSFFRTFTLPDTVDADKISADYVNGILNVVIPKKDEAKVSGPKSINIS